MFKVPSLLTIKFTKFWDFPGPIFIFSKSCWYFTAILHRNQQQCALLSKLKAAEINDINHKFCSRSGKLKKYLKSKEW